jgi:hypothetical protein
MAELNLVLSDKERTYLTGLLSTALKDTRVEAHRTHTPGYREEVLDQEQLIRGLLARLETAQK